MNFCFSKNLFLLHVLSDFDKFMDFLVINHKYLLLIQIGFSAKNFTDNLTDDNIKCYNFIKPIHLSSIEGTYD